jgi:hydrogenase nickel incorporation protein HypB
MCRTCGCGEMTHEHGHDHAHDHEHGHDHTHDHERGHDHAHGHESERRRTIRLERGLLAKNDRLAADNRTWLAEQRVAMFNLIGSPGAGKTALLEATVRRLAGEVELAVLEGDQATDLDAERIRRAGCRVLQFNTGAGCHLDASMIDRGLREIAPGPGTVLFVENVGNLVCPAMFDLGERAKIVVMSVTEGEDKPLKYPHVFRAADLWVLTKMDLAPHVDFDLERCRELALRVNPALELCTVSAKHNEGLGPWCEWVRRQAVVDARAVPA